MTDVEITRKLGAGERPNSSGQCNVYKVYIWRLCCFSMEI